MCHPITFFIFLWVKFSPIATSFLFPAIVLKTHIIVETNEYVNLFKQKNKIKVNGIKLMKMKTITSFHGCLTQAHIISYVEFEWYILSAIRTAAVKMLCLFHKT